MKIKDAVIDTLFPPLCAHCGILLRQNEKDGVLCAKCMKLIRIHTSLFCAICGARLPENKKICHKNAPYLLGAATDYDEIVRMLIHQLKYGRYAIFSHSLNSIMDLYLDALTLQPRGNTIVIPIPLHHKREKSRGFNQAGLLAAHCARKFNISLETENLIRTRHTLPQAELDDWEQRRENLRDSFALKNPGSIAKKDIIIVDDISTSGATMNEAARVLKSAGATRILALVIAKAR